MTLSEGAMQLFKEYANDAGNWNGMPLVGGNVMMNDERKGYLTDLKKKGLVTTYVDDEDTRCAWLSFTEEGKLLAKSLGVKLS